MRLKFKLGHAIVLRFRSSAWDFALATDTQGAFQRMMCLTLVQTDLGTALHVGVQQPIDCERYPNCDSYSFRG